MNYTSITLGKLGGHKTAPSPISGMAALINSGDDFKFCVHGAKPGEIGPYLMDIGFSKSYGIRQDEIGNGKGGLKHGFCDEHGAWLGTPNVDQETATITHDQAAGKRVFWKAEVTAGAHGAGPVDLVFQGGGN